jgi:NTE family protein
MAKWPTAAGQVVVPTTIAAEHTLASAAIPILFPAVRVEDQLFVDGSLRQNTPIRPAMHLGADRLLVVGLRHQGRAQRRQLRAREVVKEVYPNAVFMLGKMLNALMLDKLDVDLARIERTNTLLEAGSRIYGPDFGKRIAEAIGGERHDRPYKHVDVTLVRPSENLGDLAWKMIRANQLDRYQGVVARWLRRLVNSGEIEDSDVASYILFDPDYITQLIELGYRDAQAQHDELEALFQPGALLHR